VELPCLVDAQGIQPTRIGVLPPQLAALCQTNINVQTLTVEAALTGKREHIYHAVMLDPHTASVLPLEDIWAMCDDLIAEHQKHGLLGDFAPTISGTGRSWAGTGDRVLAHVEVGAASEKSNGKIEAEIVFTNPRSTAFLARLTADCVGSTQVAGSGHETALKVKVPANSTLRKRVTFPRSRENGDSFAVRLVSASPDLFTRDYVVLKRQILSAAGKEGAGFELKLAGFPAVQGNIAVQKEVIALRLVVDDTKITPSLKPWEGSGVEIFFSEIHGGEVCQLFLVPQPGGRTVRVLNRQLKPVSSIRARMGRHPSGAGYEMNAEIPFATAEIPRGSKSFLFDTIVHLTALGDAHAGGATSLSGEFDSNRNSTRFVRVDAGQ
jgi:hypothetical protein